MSSELNEREKTILRSIVHNFIHTATPVGSRYISKKNNIGLSPATVRNVMSDLEEQGFLDHPHTSAGRIPTDKGYRFYVDSLMDIERLTANDQSEIQSQLQSTVDTETILKITSKLLGSISHQLGVVGAPRFSTGIFEKLELVQISNSRLLIIISMRSGLIKTLTMEINSEIPRTKLEEVSRILNERLSNLTLNEIQHTFSQRVHDVLDEETGLIRLFIDSVDTLFDEKTNREKIHIGGAKNILSQPEFVNTEHFKSIIELFENEDIIFHVLEQNFPKEGSIAVTIGKEIQEDTLREYSVVSSTYSVSGVTGTIGIIGTKRMNYSKMIPLVDYVAKTISTMFSTRQ